MHSCRSRGRNRPSNPGEERHAARPKFDRFVALGERWPIDAVCISVASNPPGRSWYMDEVDAARAARGAKATTLIPQHFDFWRGLTLDPERVRIAPGWYCPGTRVIPARLGERITLDVATGHK